ncbi:hypothetical protein MA16_Dca022892 [Dendrobium catenatum]|uniref:Uncharacterized protein n=1 Tax=Dendrobium catenatum TaxID=906689 RepID=A0A2I0VCP7_9ASPA|nr:hypothetical protein MA16_Dca022892 [Dendrobium catenatum]
MSTAPNPYPEAFVSTTNIWLKSSNARIEIVVIAVFNLSKAQVAASPTRSCLSSAALSEAMQCCYILSRTSYSIMLILGNPLTPSDSWIEVTSALP